MNPPPPSGFALYRPRLIGVAERSGTPERIAGRPVETVREEWLVEDRWWTRDPLRRHYFELILDGGRRIVVFHDLGADQWYEQNV